MIQRHAGRLAGGVMLLALVWIGVYWLWPADGIITFGHDSPRVSPAASKDIPATPPPPPGPATAADAKTSQALEAPPEFTGPPTPGVVPPKFSRYTIRKGDTLASIAAAQLGSADKAELIARANPLKNPLKLEPGRELLIPLDPANVQGQPPRPGEPMPKAEDRERTYVVQKGDSLSRISVEMFGTPKYATFLYESNRDVLAREDALRIGQTLRVPPRPR